MTLFPLAFLAPGGGEMLMILLALLLLFGPKDAPRVLRNLINAFRKFQRTAADLKQEILASDRPGGRPDPATRDTTVYDQAKAPPPAEESRP